MKKRKNSFYLNIFGAITSVGIVWFAASKENPLLALVGVGLAFLALYRAKNSNK